MNEKENSALLVTSEEQFRAMFDAIDVGFCIIEILFDDNGTPVDYRFLTSNPAFANHTGLVDVLGKRVRELIPNHDDIWFQMYGKVAVTGESVRFESYAAAMNRWFEVDAARVGVPEDRTVGVLFTDISKRKEAERIVQEAEQRERIRLKNIFMRAPAFMATLRGPNHVYELANLPYYQLIGRLDDFDTQNIIGKTVEEVIPEMVEQGFIELLDQVYRTGEAFVGSDSRVVFQTEGNSPPDEHFVDFNFQPLRDEDGTVSGILVHGVDLTERKRLEQERERLLSEAQARAEREELLNRIGMTVREAREPEAILEAVVSILGQALRVDRCYFVRYNQTRDIAHVSPEWRRKEANIAPLVGRTFRMSTYSVDRDQGYKAGQTHAVEDVVSYAPEDAEPLVALHLRAMLRVPIEVGDQMRSLTVAMAHEPRHWTEDEVRLVENVAGLVRSTLEAAYAQQRERNIANQLQDALLPAPPPSLPGMDLASYYCPALQEAGVGGDFFDVFSVEKGCTALVVADLSGKGLAAAQQVAIVKNMLRFALYNGSTVSGAIARLHDTLVEYDLLTGFATLFIGMYDYAEHNLTYVNCGQEPGLLLRAATGNIEKLVPTGSVLGGFGPGNYEQRTVILEKGDVLAVFTDGLTEVGPSRKQLLGGESVGDLLSECVREAGQGVTARYVVDRLIRRIDDFSQGGTRDDIALLLGIFKGYGE